MTKDKSSFRRKVGSVLRKVRTLPIRAHNTLFLGIKKDSSEEILVKENTGLQLWGHITFQKMLNPKTGKLAIPANIRQIKLDVGTAMNAPNSAIWLDTMPDRIVFGFEPNPDSIRELVTGENRKRGSSYRYLDLKHINERFFVFNVAIDNCEPQFKSFYMTTNNGGTSSLYKPHAFKIKNKIHVPCIRLSDFLALIPWDRFEYIEHLKIDTQGSDLRVIQSAGNYLKRIVFVTAECTASGYEHTHTEAQLDRFMKDNNFEFIEGTDQGGNKTYVNKRYKNLLNVLDYTTENK